MSRQHKPNGGRKKIYGSTAERVAAYRARKNLKSFTVQIPEELFDQMEDFLKYKDLSKSAAVEKLIRTQLLRKR